MSNRTGKFVRKYGNRNKIVRVRNEQAMWMVQKLANNLKVTYQEAFEIWCDWLEARNAYSWEALSTLIDNYRSENPAKSS